MKLFWLLVSSIHKIEAEEDRRSLSIAMAAQSSAGATALQRTLLERIGDVVTHAKVDPMQERMDRSGFDELKRMATAW